MKKIALVTGGGSGIGANVAISLAKDGWDVVIAGRRKEVLDELVAQNPSLRLFAIPADVSDEKSVIALMEEMLAKFGRLDLLFNNAGVGSPAVEIDELSLTEWNRVIGINVTGMFLCAREAFRIMRNQDPKGGRIINNGSVSAYAPRPNSIAYTTTKHAITGMTKSIQLDGRPFDITASQIDIGNAATDLMKSASTGTKQADGSIKQEPTIDVSEVGRAVTYMASLPLSANVANMTLMATKMPFVGRG